MKVSEVVKEAAWNLVAKGWTLEEVNSLAGFKIVDEKGVI